MQQPEFNAFRSILQGVYALYGKDLSQPVMDLWWQAMKPFDLPAFKDAMNRHALDPDRGQFLPKPADVVRLVHGGTQDGALVAWAKVDRAVRSVGTYASVVFDDPIVHAVVTDMGGWIALGQKTEHEWPFVGKQFETRYRGYRMRASAGEYPRVLTGMADADNARQGFKLSEPVLIGNADAAQRVMLGGSAQPKLTWTRGSSWLPLLHVEHPREPA